MEFGRDLAWLAGTWVGTGYQPTESVRTFSIKVVINAAKDIYQSQYSSIPCNGKWSLLSSDGCQARFHETISAGDCRPGTVIVTQLIFAGTMSRYITWTRYLENGTLDAWATLKKN